MAELKVIARIYTDFPEKFGLPRQSGVISELGGKIVFEPPYRDFSAVKELCEFSHIWLIWGFSMSSKAEWSPTVRPPRLGGNERVGVFATRSPYRPNPLALSAVKLEKVTNDENSGPVLYVSGIDMANGTPIYDIKPYIAYADSVPNAVCGFADKPYNKSLKVVLPELPDCPLKKEKLAGLCKTLELDPRPRYHNDPMRVYGLAFSGCEVKFKVENGILTVISITEAND